MRTFLYLFLIFISVQLTAQNNEVLIEGYLLKAKNMLAERNYDEAEKLILKADNIANKQKPINLLEVATVLYVQKENYQKAKSYADLYFEKQTDKKSKEYKLMLLLYVEINDNISKNNADNEYLNTIDANYYQEAQKMFDKQNYKMSSEIVEKYFNQNPDKTTEEYQKMVLLKHSISKKQELKKLNNTIPFNIIEEVPVFPGCKGTRKEKRSCLSRGITRVVSKNFNSNLISCIEKKEIFNREKGVYEEKCIGLSSGIKRIYVLFTIDIDGTVKNITAKAPHPRLIKEAIRITKLIPKMKPGKQRGKPVRVKYTLPIIFKVE